MSNPPNGYNTDGSFNKFKGTYFNNDIDLSGGDIISRTGNLYLAPNSSIFTSDNQILFNEEFQFTDFVNNVNVLGQLKNTYNEIEYDVGLQCEKTDTLVSDVATISPIVSDTAFKCTNFYYDQALNSTIFSNNVSFGNGTIASIAINNTSFVDLTSAQSISGIKTFNSAPVMSGGSISVGTIPVNRVSGSAVNLSTAQSITSTKTWTVQQNYSNNIRLDGSLLVGTAGGTVITNSLLQQIADIPTLKTITTAINYTPLTTTTLITGILQFSGTLNGWDTTNFYNAINYSKSATSDLQTQINSLNTNSVSLSASNIFTALNQFTNNIRLDGSLIVNNNGTTLTNSTLNKIQYLSNVSSDVNTSITNLNTSVSTLNTKTTKMSYMSVGGINTTTFTDGLISQTLSFTGTINNISPTTFGYISDLTSSAQTQINSLKTKTDTTNINVATLTTNVNDFALRTTEMSYSDDPTPQTNITNKLVTEELVFTTDLNDITPTTFSYLSGVTSSIQNQLNSKIDSIVGTIIQHISGNLQTNFPTRFLLCNGQEVSRTGTYANLFAMIGVTYGSGSTGTTFNVPNFESCFLRMYSEPRTFGGVVYTPSPVGTIQQDSMEAHVHSTNLSGSYLNNSTTNGSYFSFGTSRYNTTNFPSFGGGVSASHRTTPETRPLNHAVYFYITC